MYSFGGGLGQFVNLIHEPSPPSWLVLSLATEKGRDIEVVPTSFPEVPESHTLPGKRSET